LDLRCDEAELRQAASQFAIQNNQFDFVQLYLTSVIFFIRRVVASNKLLRRSRSCQIPQQNTITTIISEPSPLMPQANDESD